MFELVLTLSGLIVVGPTSGNWADVGAIEVVVLDASAAVPCKAATLHQHEAWITVATDVLSDGSLANVQAYGHNNAGKVRLTAGPDGRHLVSISLGPTQAGPQQLTLSAGSGRVAVRGLGGLAKLSEVDTWAQTRKSVTIGNLEGRASTLTLRGGVLEAGGRAEHPDGSRVRWEMKKPTGGTKYGSELELPDWIRYRLPSLSVATIESDAGWHLTMAAPSRVEVAITNHPKHLLGSSDVIDHFLRYYTHLPQDQSNKRPSCEYLHRPARVPAATGVSSATVLCPPGGWP